MAAQEPLELVGCDHGGWRVVGLGLGGGRARDGRRRLQTRLALLHRVRHHLGVKVSTKFSDSFHNILSSKVIHLVDFFTWKMSTDLFLSCLSSESFSKSYISSVKPFKRSVVIIVSR